MSGNEGEPFLRFVEYLRRIAPRQPGMHGGQALGHAAQLEANKREKALRKEYVCVFFNVPTCLYICLFLYFFITILSDEDFCWARLQDQVHQLAVMKLEEIT